jgi:hypothetical protein
LGGCPDCKGAIVRVVRWICNLWLGVLILNALLATLLLGGRFGLPLTDRAPALAHASPPSNSSEIPVRSQFVLQFTRPMNPRITEQAIQINPPLSTTLSWDAALTTLTISPTVVLQAASDYQITIATTALSQRFRPLEQPIQLNYRTAAAPAILRVVPADTSQNVPVTSPLLVQFSRPMVPTEQLMRRIARSDLQITPDLAGEALWINQQTLLFRPDGVLQPGQNYQVALPADFGDLSGGTIGQPFVWNFSSAAPIALRAEPGNNARGVAPTSPLVVQIDQPLPSDQLRAGLAISPTVSGRFDTQLLPDGTQVMTFTPTLGWELGRTYQIELPLGQTSRLIWQFDTAPRPTLIGRFPGEGQILPAGQAIRLVFSTPIDPEQVRSLLQIDPPAQLIDVRGSGSEIQVLADLRAATTYTITIPADLSDRNGASLGIAYPMRFTTAPAPSQLSLPEAPNRVITILPNGSSELLVRRTNVATLQADLYRLDEATLVRTLVFNEADWRQFEPERYQLPLQRSWIIPLSDTLNAVVEDRIKITNSDGSALPPGSYYLRLRTPEGLRADLLMLVTTPRLQIRLGSTAGVVWATDGISGTVLPNLPVAVYQDDVLLLEGQTDTNGVLTFPINASELHRYAALARGSEPALAVINSVKNQATIEPSLRLFLSSNATSYQPGESIQVMGVARQVVSDTLSYPNATIARLRLMSTIGRTMRQIDVPIDSRGVFSATLTTEQWFGLGSYQLNARIGSAQATLPIEIHAPLDPSLRLQVLLPSPTDSNSSTGLTAFVVAEQDQQPWSSKPISWTLQAEALPAPLPPPYQTGSGAFALPITRSGTATSDLNGRLSIPLTTTIALEQTQLRYRLNTTIASPQGIATAQTSFTLHANQRYLGIHLPQQVLPSGTTATVELIVVDTNGQPQPNVPIQLQILRPNGPDEQPFATRRLTSNATGRAQAALPLAGSGEFLVRASIANQNTSSGTIRAEAAVWSIGAAASTADLRLIANQASYEPGSTAMILATLPEPRQALVMVERGGAIETSLRQVGASIPLTTTLQASDRPAARVAILLPARNAERAQTADLLIPLTSNQPTLPQILLEADRSTYNPGATAVLTITVTDPLSATLDTDLLIALVGEEDLPTIDQFNIPANSPVSPHTRPLFWSGPIRASAGVLTIGVPLPPVGGNYRVIVWATAAEGITRIIRPITIEQPIQTYLDLPPFVRTNDTFALSARLLNTEATTQTVRASLTGTGFLTIGNNDEQQITLAPLSSQQIAWPVTVVATDTLRIELRNDQSGNSTRTSAELPIRSDARAAAALPATHTILTEVRDPLSNRLLPTAARATQTHIVRWTIILTETIDRPRFILPLPAGSRLDALHSSIPLISTQQPGQIVIEATRLEPGVYIIRALVTPHYQIGNAPEPFLEQPPPP